MYIALSKVLAHAVYLMYSASIGVNHKQRGTNIYDMKASYNPV